MEEMLFEVIARSMWEAMNPGGVPWMCIPNEEIRERMRNKAQDLLQHEMGIPLNLTPAECREGWRLAQPGVTKVSKEELEQVAASRLGAPVNVTLEGAGSHTLELHVHPKP